MAKTPANHGKQWTPQDIAGLKKEVRANTPTRLIALHLDRTVDAVYAKASNLNISLAPTNQSPDKRRGH
ncbi:hypothetical protein OYT1_ch1389 [Ferriphaselus amnicola]|uniref:Uncharacterized protein n=1 Tax=Ferriphaselus amnicola TaxID=1188319 RepID=A0A2Z6GBV2_9PROT|nr:hypothetical protein [Ferriphaselus amnicola]BBE50946.1 hypothetical protein OYT1_ch1389 [Ferriphaselus amnicola]